MKPYFLLTIFALTLLIEVNAQGEYNWQSADLAKLGVVRMVSKKTTLPHSTKESERVLITETFFDSLGRTLRSQNDACSNCGTVQEFDSLTGLVSYVYTFWQNGFRETFLEYDAKKRRIASETCGNGDDDDCAYYSFEYDEENTERMYKSIQRRQIKRDTAKQSKHLFRIYSKREEEKQLVRESFFSPEGQLEETKNYSDGKFQNALLYEYDGKGRKMRTWNFDGKIKQLYHEIERNEDRPVNNLENIYYFYGRSAPYPQRTQYSNL